MKVVLIPGFTFGASFLSSQLDAMKRAGLDAHIYTIHLENDDESVQEILDLYSGPLILVGQSMGARHCFLAANKAPSRIKKIISLQGGPAGPSSDANISSIKKNVEVIIDKLYPSGQLAEFRKQLLEGTIKGGPDIKKSRVLLKQSMDELCDQHLLNQSKALRDNIDIHDCLGNIRARTLIIHSENDQFYTLADQLYLHKMIGHSAFCVLRGVGHGACLQTPLAVNSLIELWACNDL